MENERDQHTDNNFESFKFLYEKYKEQKQKAEREKLGHVFFFLPYAPHCYVLSCAHIDVSIKECMKSASVAL